VYVRLGTFNLDEVLPYVILNANKLPKVADRGKLLYKEYLGIPIKMNTRNLQLFSLKTPVCKSCKRKGAYFALEFQSSDAPDITHTLNLYGYGDVLFTKDHIIPVSIGGSNSLDNLQPMCIKCNEAKANKVNRKLLKRGVLKLEHLDNIKDIVSPKLYKFLKKKAKELEHQKDLPLHKEIKHHGTKTSINTENPGISAN